MFQPVPGAFGASWGAGVKRAPRVLIYSHDTFGLGHLRRSRAIANALVQAAPDASVVIVTGSPVVGSFDFGNGVDFVRVPGVVKLPDGDYTTLNLKIGLDEAVALREAIIRNTALALDPDLVIVDKEPTGFRGEILPTLQLMKQRGARLVLGIRDVMDEPALLAPEWERKGAVQALVDFYDDIWIYGLRRLYEPLAALDLPEAVRNRITYTGYLRRELPDAPQFSRYPKLTRGPFVLVTTGGGGDGPALLDWVVSAYERDPDIPIPALVVFGPFVSRGARQSLMGRIAKLEKVDAIAFDSKIEHLMQKASAIVAMGGYNTFCEILSMDKPGLIVPRKTPRLEQAIRAQFAEEAGLVRQLDGLDNPPSTHDPLEMAAAIRALMSQPKPSQAVIPDLLDGLERIGAMTRPWFEDARTGRGRSGVGMAAE
ncbi:membrane protein [Alsobacter metallidurans]|uniref:Membrane protein n=1 Tax=Alsobacter metallidurans TaxID=340221 RepID=A0A917MIK4_9HYPH|nr:glycosyltransferase [Alsobacter metallidurans]GGH11864.1 membrane protein [Alsobacter metallidurans]